MVKKTLTIIIDNEAKRQLREAYQYIKKDSVQNAEKVRSTIIATIKELIKNPEQHPPDKYRLNNDGCYGLMKFANTALHIIYPKIRLLLSEYDTLK